MVKECRQFVRKHGTAFLCLRVRHGTEKGWNDIVWITIQGAFMPNVECVWNAAITLLCAASEIGWFIDFHGNPLMGGMIDLNVSA